MAAVYVFFLWTLAAYWIHRLAHLHPRGNPLWWVHRHHHWTDYTKGRPIIPHWSALLLWQGSWLETVDILMTLSLPLVVLCFLFGGNSWYLLPYHYVYEAVFAAGLLDHNIRLKSRITNFFPWGKFHLYHHDNMRANYSFQITLWDFLFRTASLRMPRFM